MVCLNVLSLRSPVETNKTTKDVSKDHWYPGQDSKRILPDNGLDLEHFRCTNPTGVLAV